jgi:prepilin-type N-terminal cleavage/methylation domain-containing protein
MREFMMRPEGFTLIELMIVILIIAILVAIAVPVYLNARANAQRRTCQSNIRTVDGAIQAYEGMFDNPVYPASLDDMVQPDTRVLKSIPTCPYGSGSYGWITGDPPDISCPKI